ncbi:exopolysaccharide biosynthesis polyprenyl glycosylphosphotransferase [Candidatus Saccharibacteria bacterium]|nr:exopolysaccharide biosynthesis polyprenyl glycosylphosphotransferase [Candidatus Saccharibacteria bacterium]MBQ6605744.1 exopolysaccharide biosynthesis polyprenyl glycosylphosphotransferase [Candidatus Saccharibacteria bacterium]
MKKDSASLFRLFLILGDALAIILAFSFAYFFRTHIDPRPYFFESEIVDFIKSIFLLVPGWILILASLGLYKKTFFIARRARTNEACRLLLASVIGTMFIITFDFFGRGNLFPVRIIAVYSAGLCFVFLILIRNLIRFVRKRIFLASRGGLRAIVVGNNKNTDFLSDYISSFPESGYNLAGVVASKKYIPKDLYKRQYSSVKEAVKKLKPDVIFLTDERQTEYVYKMSIERHLLYYFVPSEAALSSQIGDVELIGNTPVIRVNATPLNGGMSVVKRFFDLFLGGLILLLALIPMLILWLIIKFSDLKNPAVYSEDRLSQYNRKFKIYKFRSMKAEYSGMSPEEAFKKMGKPELIKQYRKNGDYLKSDPRITKIGKFIRKTSLDELPQLFNVVKGDISLVGPRALVPGELRTYGDRSLLLSVKSGLTGLAQVSGRRDISFEERRALDIYYIRNWSLLLDLQILFRTIVVVLKFKGAK